MKTLKATAILLVVVLTITETLQTCSSTVALTTCTWDTNLPLRLNSYKPYLTIARGNLDRIPSRAFTLLPEVTILRLSGNKIKTVEPESFKGLNLKQLYLNDNQLSQVGRSDFKELDSLEKLDLSLNKITTIDAKAFEKLSHLVELNLAFNSLKKVPTAVNSLVSLKVLRLDNNQIATVSAGDFVRLSNLEQLLLNDNKISRIESGGFEGLTSLKQIDLRSNYLTELNVQELKTVRSLKSINLGINNFKCTTLQTLVDEFKRSNIEVVKGFNRNQSYVNGIRCQVV